jgi:hypothetical protein
LLLRDTFLLTQLGASEGWWFLLHTEEAMLEVQSRNNEKARKTKKQKKIGGGLNAVPVRHFGNFFFKEFPTRSSIHY